MTESQFTRKICAELTAAGAVVFACVGGEMQQPGWPDRYVCSELFTGWLEFKAVGGRLSELQAHRMCELNSRRPGTAWVVRMPGYVQDPRTGEQWLFLNGKNLLEVLHGLCETRI